MTEEEKNEDVPPTPMQSSADLSMQESAAQAPADDDDEPTEQLPTMEDSADVIERVAEVVGKAEASHHRNCANVLRAVAKELRRS